MKGWIKYTMRVIKFSVTKRDREHKKLKIVTGQKKNKTLYNESSSTFRCKYPIQLLPTRKRITRETLVTTDATLIYLYSVLMLHISLIPFATNMSILFKEEFPIYFYFTMTLNKKNTLLTIFALKTPEPCSYSDV